MAGIVTSVHPPASSTAGRHVGPSATLPPDIVRLIEVLARIELRHQLRFRQVHQREVR
jgi:hypothetical protein